MRSISLIRATYVIVLTCGMALLFSCAGSSSYSHKELSVNAVDSDSVEICAVYTLSRIGSIPSRYEAYINTTYDKSVATTADYPYSECELMRLGVWEDEAGVEHSLRMLSGTLLKYYVEQGEMPKSSEVVINNLDCDTRSVVGHMYNPITGRLYEGFSANEWDVNSAYVEITTDPEEAKRILIEKNPNVEFDFGSIGYPEPTCAVRIVIYGSQPGSIIFDDYFF